MYRRDHRSKLGTILSVVANSGVIESRKSLPRESSEPAATIVRSLPLNTFVIIVGSLC